MQISVFGLGKSSYEHYNAMGKFFAKAMERLGAEVIHPHSEGDDMGSLEEDFLEWKISMAKNIKKYLLSQNTNVK